MKERLARDVMLMSAIEQTDQERRILSDEDRMYASRSAHELARWEVSDKRSAMSVELFLAKRAEQVLKKIAERHRGFSKFIAPANLWRFIGVGLPLVAFLSGFLVDRIADPHRVDLLSAPLLLIIVWNVAVYVWLLISAFIPAFKRHPGVPLRLARFTSGRLPARRTLPQPLTVALGRFGEEWTRMSMPLSRTRLNRIVHVGALCFALGAILSLYGRGVFTEYRVGWESTFLNAEQVHAMLTFLFTPVMSLLQLQGFSIADVRASQFTQTVSGTEGARWVHLYAGTLLLVVVLPRLALALFAGWKESRLSNHFPIDLAQPYFRKLASIVESSAPAVMRVFPYSFTIDELRDKNLSLVAQMLIGEQARVMLRPSTGYGDAPEELLGHASVAKSEIALTVALFNLSATPEKENHGDFLDHLARAAPGKLLALIDESAYLERVGDGSGSASRIEERIALWRQFCELHKVHAVIVNLINPSKYADELDRGLATLDRSR
ncbi:DUF2868 domain-containing protein [Noviherbaspirillum sp.]|uniref:DUF2868 domain-containing protein n=1 Tax=Noviherbaspirillum sp. TaxID=1926288 RepID=UPI002FE061A1